MRSFKECHFVGHHREDLFGNVFVPFGNSNGIVGRRHLVGQLVRNEAIGEQVVLRCARFLDGVKSTVVIGNDQAIARNKGTGAAVDAANTIHQTDLPRIEDLLGSEL